MDRLIGEVGEDLLENLKSNKDLLFSTGESTPYSAVACVGKESGQERLCECIYLIPLAVHLKLTQHCKSATLQ